MMETCKQEIVAEFLNLIRIRHEVILFHTNLSVSEQDFSEVFEAFLSSLSAVIEVVSDQVF